MTVQMKDFHAWKTSIVTSLEKFCIPSLIEEALCIGVRGAENLKELQFWYSHLSNGIVPSVSWYALVINLGELFDDVQKYNIFKGLPHIQSLYVKILFWLYHYERLGTLDECNIYRYTMKNIFLLSVLRNKYCMISYTIAKLKQHESLNPSESLQSEKLEKDNKPNTLIYHERFFKNIFINVQSSIIKLATQIYTEKLIAITTETTAEITKVSQHYIEI